MEVITSRRNPHVREWRRLRRPDVARSQSLILVEGAQPVMQALAWGQRVQALLICPELAKPETLRLVLERASSADHVYELSADAFASLSLREGPAGIAAVVELQVSGLAELTAGSGDLILALWQVESPGNLGTIIRTADSFGARAVLLVDRCTNPHNPLTAKASMGALFHTPLLAARDMAELRAWCDGQRVPLAGTSAHGATPSTEWRPRLPLVLLFGREGSGLSPEAIALCDYTVCIPQAGVTTSLNLATAAGILTYLAVHRAQQ